MGFGVEFGAGYLDCKPAADSVRSTKQDVYESGAIIVHCREYLNSKQNFIVEFVRR